jgi:hypothetical protein
VPWPIMFNQVRMNLPRPMTLFPEIFDENSLLPGPGKHKEAVEELLASSYCILDEDWLLDFHMTLGTTRDLSNSIRVKMQITSEMFRLRTYWTPCTSPCTKFRTTHKGSRLLLTTDPGAGMLLVRLCLEPISNLLAVVSASCKHAAKGTFDRPSEIQVLVPSANFSRESLIGLASIDNGPNCQDISK